MARDPCKDCGGSGVDDDGYDCEECGGSGEVEDEAFDGDTAPAIGDPE